MTLDEAGKVIVARIIIDSVIERQGLLRPGDLILEANSIRVKTPEQLQNIIEESPEFLSLKIQPTLSVSQSQPLNTTERSSLALPNKVAQVKRQCPVCLTMFNFSIMFGACSAMIHTKTPSCLVPR